MNKQTPKIKRGEIIEIEIVDLAFGGKGIGKIEDYVVFVQNTIPGQIVETRLTKKRNRFAEGKLIRVIQRSPQEVETPYQAIPGAPYASWPISLQKASKKETTFQLFKRIGDFARVEEIYDEFIDSPLDWHYRNKMEYSFSPVTQNPDSPEYVDAFALGFKHRGQWLSVDNLKKDSGLFDKQLEDNLWRVKEFCEATQLGAWHPKRHTGLFRNLTVRKSFTEDALLVDLTTCSNGLEQFDFDAFIELIKDILGDRLAGIMHTINDSTGDRSSSDAGIKRCVYGRDILQQELLGLNFEMSMDSFFQPNPNAAERLYSKAVDYAVEGDDSNGVIMDLFCGTGTIGQILAQRTGGRRKVIGVDIVESAIENAKANAERNGLEGLDFFAADVGKFLAEYPEYQNNIGTIVLDPPRAGIAPKTLQKVIELNAPRIVYVSCNPATQARDQIELRKAGYQFKKLSMVDQFPHTSHIETIALFDKA